VKPSVAFFLALRFFSPRWCESELLELDNEEDVDYWLVEEESSLWAMNACLPLYLPMFFFRS
jgi:hypothetical protein